MNNNSEATILAPWEFEKLCRTELKSNSKRSSQAVQMVLECSVMGRGWNRCVDLHKRLSRQSEFAMSNFLTTVLAVGFIEHKKDRLESPRDAHSIRLADHIDTINVESAEGKKMLKIRKALNITMLKHNKATPLVALILIAVYLRKIFRSNEIYQFINSDNPNTSTPLRIFKWLDDLGFVQLERCRQGRVKPILLIHSIDGW